MPCHAVLCVCHKLCTAQCHALLYAMPCCVLSYGVDGKKGPSGSYKGKGPGAAPWRKEAALFGICTGKVLGPAQEQKGPGAAPWRDIGGKRVPGAFPWRGMALVRALGGTLAEPGRALPESKV